MIRIVDRAIGLRYRPFRRSVDCLFVQCWPWSSFLVRERAAFSASLAESDRRQRMQERHLIPPIHPNSGEGCLKRDVAEMIEEPLVPCWQELDAPEQVMMGIALWNDQIMAVYPTQCSYGRCQTSKRSPGGSPKIRRLSLLAYWLSAPYGFPLS